MNFRLKPGRPGLLVHDPETMRPLAPEGEVKPQSTYWHRRVACGDAVEIPDPQTKPARPAKQAPADSPSTEGEE